MQEKEKEVLRYMKYSDFRVIVDSLKQIKIQLERTKWTLQKKRTKIALLLVAREGRVPYNQWMYDGL